MKIPIVLNFMTGHSDAKFQIAGLKWQMKLTFKKFGLSTP